MLERRRALRRRNDDRRAAGAAVDVTRIEHENLYDQGGQILRTLQRIDGELRELAARVRRLEGEHAETG